MAAPALPGHIQAMLSPDAYPDPVDGVELRQTHISYLFFAGDFVYKLKKPLDLGFLNFTTLEQRHHFCQEEVRLNRRLCSETDTSSCPVCNPSASTIRAMSCAREISSIWQWPIPNSLHMGRRRNKFWRVTIFGNR